VRILASANNSEEILNSQPLIDLSINGSSVEEKDASLAGS